MRKTFFINTSNFFAEQYNIYTQSAVLILLLLLFSDWSVAYVFDWPSIRSNDMQTFNKYYLILHKQQHCTV